MTDKQDAAEATIPREPTTEMIDAALGASARYGRRAMANIWQRMFDAAPKPATERADAGGLVVEAIADFDAMIKRTGEEPSDFNRGYRSALVDLKIALTEAAALKPTEPAPKVDGLVEQAQDYARLHCLLDPQVTAELTHLKAENARLKALLGEAKGKIADLADAARSACDAKKYPSLTEALFEADNLLATLNGGSDAE